MIFFWKFWLSEVCLGSLQMYLYVPIEEKKPWAGHTTFITNKGKLISLTFLLWVILLFSWRFAASVNSRVRLPIYSAKCQSQLKIGGCLHEKAQPLGNVIAFCIWYQLKSHLGRIEQRRGLLVEPGLPGPAGPRGGLQGARQVFVFVAIFHHISKLKININERSGACWSWWTLRVR